MIETYPFAIAYKILGLRIRLGGSILSEEFFDALIKFSEQFNFGHRERLRVVLIVGIEVITPPAPPLTGI